MLQRFTYSYLFIISISDPSADLDFCVGSPYAAL